jgi:alpha-beta hydrolase superfamily lysophospholipase
MTAMQSQTPADVGLDGAYWHRYYDKDEVDEIIASTTQVTTVISGRIPLHVRVCAQPEPERAPTVVMSHGMMVYGLALARLQLPFYRAGYNIVLFDLPGMGQSGGPRGGCTTRDIFTAWHRSLDYAGARFGGPLYAMGVAEDGVTCYYVSSTRSDVAAISVHTLFEYGDPGGSRWQGPGWLVRLKAAGLVLGAALRPSLSVPVTWTIRYDDVFAGPGDESFIERLAGDPLSLHRVELRLAASLLRRRRPRVSFEDCRLPVQIIGSTENRLWPMKMLRRSYRRLGGPKDFVELAGAPQWESNRAFQENYSAHVIRWFEANGAPAGLATRSTDR